MMLADQDISTSKYSKFCEIDSEFVDSEFVDSEFVDSEFVDSDFVDSEFVDSELGVSFDEQLCEKLEFFSFLQKYFFKYKYQYQ